MLDVRVNQEVLDVPLLDEPLSLGVKSIEQGGRSEVRLFGQHLFDGLEFCFEFCSVQQELDELSAGKLRTHRHRI